MKAAVAFTLALIGIKGAETQAEEGLPVATPGGLVAPGGEGSCAFAVEDTAAALTRGRDKSIPGNTINIQNLNMGQTGNHFAIVSRFLSLGYCCKSKLVTLPPKDPVVAPGMFGEGVHGPRHFDFSSAPDVPGFHATGEQKCRETIDIGGMGAYYALLRSHGSPRGVWKNENLAACVESVRLLECEAAYLFPKGADFCSPAAVNVTSEHARMGLTTTSDAGHLVFHMRSGGIYRTGLGRTDIYGQPPLSYYTSVLNSREWKRVDIVTNYEGNLHNPVLPALRTLVDTGTWPRSDIAIHTSRPLEVDLQAMLCADALATARSTLGMLTMYHTRATTVYLPSTCKGDGSDFGLTPQRLMAARSGHEENTFQVYGVELKPGASQYRLYAGLAPAKHRNPLSEAERLEMLEYQGIAGVVDCAAPP